MLGPGRGIGSRLLRAGELLGVHRLGVDLYRGLFQRAVADIAVLLTEDASDRKSTRLNSSH